MVEWSTLKRLILLRMVTGGSSGTVTTVTGASPLALANALAKPIKSLIQYGKVITVDGEMFCNNGKLVAVDDELPSGYKRITGIKFDGDFWYNTNEPLTGDDEVTMTLANTATTGQNVFGSYNGTSGGAKNFSLYIYGGGSTSSSYFRYGEQLLRPKFGGNKRTITFGKSGTSGFATDVTATPETFETEASAYIGMLPNSSSSAYSGSIIGSITVGTRLKWIPCERESDGMIGYYEAVSGVFLEPIGTGTPVAGSYDTSHLNVLSVEGAPEVLSIGEDTASGAIASFETTKAAPVRSLLASITPIQDLNGYDNPWPAGGGKNKLNFVYPTTTRNGITLTNNGDGTYTANGTATATAVFEVYPSYLESGVQYVLTGCPAGGSTSTYGMDTYSTGMSVVRDYGNGSAAFTYNDGTRYVRILVFSGATVSGVVFKPMVRLASVTDPTFAPYENICPISGWSAVGIDVTGKNLIATSNATSGLCGYRAGDTLDTVVASARYSHSAQIPARGGLKLSYRSNNVSTFNQCLIECFVGRNWASAITGDAVSDTSTVRVLTVPANTYDWVKVMYSAPGGGVVGTNINGEIQLETGSTATAYHPFAGDTYTITIGDTVYGCKLDVTNGVLMVDRANIASYNGETLPGEWISDRDVYSSGATPTIGAQVVYKLATPITIHLDPVTVSTLLGTNNVWSDTGDVTVTYAPAGVVQTASVVNLFSDGTVHDEQDIISGAVTRRTEVVVSGGVITVSALAEPVTEHVTAQHMRTAEGNNTVTVTSAVAPADLSVTYYTAQE